MSENEDTRYILIHLYQGIQISAAGIPFCDTNDLANNISSRDTVSEVIPLEALLVPLAMLQPVTNLDRYFGCMYFFWSNMSRTAAPLEGHRISFDFQDDDYSASEDDA